MKLKLKREEYKWDEVEKNIGKKISGNYREFYETIGSVYIDDFLYIVPPEDVGKGDGIKENWDYFSFAYGYLKSEWEDIEELPEYNGEEGWMPVGTTSNGDFIFCSKEKVMVTDGGFEEREEYEGTLLDFVGKYLKDEIRSRIFPEYPLGVEHEVIIVSK